MYQTYILEGHQLETTTGTVLYLFSMQLLSCHTHVKVKQKKNKTSVCTLDFITLFKFQVMLIYGMSVPCLLECIFGHVPRVKVITLLPPRDSTYLSSLSSPHLLKVGQQLHHYSLPIRPQQVGWLLLDVSWRNSERLFMMYALANIDDYKGKHYSAPFNHQVQQWISFSGWFSVTDTLYLSIHSD